jgi:peptide/nickel transport system permease protein
MSRSQKLAWGFLAAVTLVALSAGFVSGYGYDEQRRAEASLAPGPGHLLGTDDLGRDRWSRLLYGTRISLLLAPTAAVLSTTLAGFVGLAAGLARARNRRVLDTALTLITDVFLGLPWLFILLAVRAALPLNLNAAASLTITGLLLGTLGWASGARLVRTSTLGAATASFVLQAEAAGVSHWRVALRHIAPNLRPVLTAQFLITVPAFLHAEATLSLLGLGVAEPLPSLGNLLSELTTFPPLQKEPWLLAPAALLVALIVALQRVVPSARTAKPEEVH